MTDNEQLKILKRKRGSVEHKLTCFTNYFSPINSSFEKDSSSITEKMINELQLRVDNLELAFEQFEGYQVDIESLCVDEELNDQYNERDEFMNMYSKYLSDAKFVLSKLTSKKSCSSRSSSESNQVKIRYNETDLRLPPINLPIFNSDMNNWLEFKDTFHSLIHDNTILTDIQKYHYLRSSIQGEALKIINSVEFSAKSYNVAWDNLCARYDNSKLLKDNHIKSLFNIQPIVKESASGLRDLLDDLNKHMRSLTSLALPTEYWDALIIYIIVLKLDKVTTREWEKHKLVKNLEPTLEDLKTFLSDRADFLNLLESNQNIQTRKSSRYSLLTQNNSPKCYFCNQDHNIYYCEQFLGLSISKRWEKIRQLKLCSNCLLRGHFSKKCKNYGCKKCKSKHNTLLHDPEYKKQLNNDQGNSENSGESKVEFSDKNQEVKKVLSNVSDYNNYVLLGTAVVCVKDCKGNTHKVKAILDSGSQSCFISEDLCKKLGCEISEANISISGITNTISPIKNKCRISISAENNDFETSISCFILKKITENLPIFNFNISTWNIPSSIQLADKEFYVSSKIDLLIGAELFWNLLMDGRIVLGKNRPVLQNTVFGYIVSGHIPISASNSQCYFITNHTLHDNLEKFWSVEEENHSYLWSNEDKLCEEHFCKTYERAENGQFIVRLPLKMNVDQLGESKRLALKRLLNLERRFERDLSLKEMYVSFMDEYKDLNHMTLLNNIDNSKPSYFLPHHGVIREDSLTTKLRTVFDGSAATSSGKSLNDIQFKGPAIQNDIVHILLRFRIHSIVVTADIAKMYRCVLVHPDDRFLQRILWRTSGDEPISIFELNTVTYGTVSAPFLAIRCLKQLASENYDNYPVACHIIDQDFYVDDMITGFDNKSDAIKTCKEIFNILNSASFYLRKWNSNVNEVSQCFDSDSSLGSLNTLNLGNDEPVKTLGIQWTSKTDILSYKICIESSRDSNFTKRDILSEISKVYDPLGLVSPCIVLVKILIQKLWTLKLYWDENIPFDLEKGWKDIRNDLIVLNKLEIPRHVILRNYKKIELHGFCDASQDAYSAVIYFRTVNDVNKIQVSLLCAKTKVAPLKSLTIPRLELCGALLLARLTKVVTEAIPINFEKYYWCDSQIVLHWLNKQPTELQVFVGHRVSEIQNLTDIKCWSYVNTKENSADIASRGICPSDLLKCKIWWDGPSFLRGPSTWPISLDEKIPIQVPELKKEKCLIVSIKPNDIFQKYSTLNKLVRVWAYCKRFISNLKVARANRDIGSLTVKELKDSLNSLVKLAQIESFGPEIDILSSNKCLKVKHRLLGLAPFIDSNGLLRVGGRLKNSSLSLLIYESEHLKMLHAGPQLLLAVRQQFWVTSGMNVAKSVVRKCVRCFRYKPQFASSIMADLPYPRVNVSSPFSVTGVDYAGPFILKDRKGRGCKLYKAYLCLFICFATKAIHLEVVSDLSTESFIAALRRFCCRRGVPSNIYSDNGSNFVGAQKDLKLIYDFLLNSQEDIIRMCASERIIWHFIPPNSPNFGGIWESNIKGVKFHLHRVVGDTILTYEEIHTFLVQIEATLNFRPLHPMSNDPNDIQPLTPSHFLIGRPLVSLPYICYENAKINRLSRFQMIQQMHQGFWKPWSKFYLLHLQQRNKWKQGNCKLIVGSLVLIKNDNMPPAKWLMGRIIQLHPGADKVVRVVTIKTANGVLKRGISKICVIPLASEEETQSILNTSSVQGGSMVMTER